MPMKTTFDLPESLIRDVKRIAKNRGTTAKDVVRLALMRVVAEESSEPFVLRDASVSGGGLTPEFANATWAEILAASYGDRW